ncbi:class II fructose-bisphosphate aldolase family protein [Frankia sp. AgB1.9]|uniref:class II fructose-bisphosphate aldolase n=1 Tax=unclassified Frankia TaxID=2632575 RepID=UPI0019313AF0|nr:MULTISPECIES: class II fructose-bisphosphate aldolase [unclassified Frankia]MBL7487735.1 class II fructose-bisphosphate aldolase family protein [Frankia sp. AgW1.1]MBL7548022.1 class II fructose-bisphosphate aldolase family protein [Frankia sp. AgB1.9]MBL7622747.1 class II fructose-bisphosphate aldolase family protein [Frankia sp. AgB1.8]
MTIASTGDLVAAAAARGSGVAAFNVITLEHAEAIARAAEIHETPVILQISQNAVAFHGGQVVPIAAAAGAVAGLAAVPIALHLDHVTEDRLVDAAAWAGFSSLMYDGGPLPYGENVERTRRARQVAQAAGLWVEAELGYVGGKPDAPRSAHEPGVRTDPDEALEFVEETGVDALAVAVGSSHAMTSRSAVLDLPLIEKLRARLPVPLVLHGSSGVPGETLRAAVSAGISKVNIGTALNVAMTGAIRRALADNPAGVDPRPYLATARDEITTTVLELLSVVSGAAR